MAILVIDDCENSLDCLADEWILMEIDYLSDCQNNEGFSFASSYLISYTFSFGNLIFNSEALFYSDFTCTMIHKKSYYSRRIVSSFSSRT